MKTAIYSKVVKKVARCMALGCLLLFFFGGNLMAQNDRHYIIKYLDTIWINPSNHEAGIDHLVPHYLTHSLEDATTFGPNCIWYSSNNYNYYFMDGETRKYLKAPLQLDGTISVAVNPGTQTLNNNTLDYFFYDWDHGVARGIRHFDSNCPSEYNSPGSQCWQVVWVAYESNMWKMSHVYGYEPTVHSARFLRETETEHGVEISNESGGMGNLAGFSMTYGTSHPLDGTANSYSYTKTPAYTYYHVEGRVDPSHYTNIPEESYYYYNNTYNSSAPAATPYSNVAPTRYEWSISCEGETQYLSFDEHNNDVLTANGATPTLYYIQENTTTSHVMATLTLTVTYGTEDAQVTQTRTANVTVKTHCQNPTILPPAITYVGVTLSWLPTADSYEVSWKTGTEDWNSVIVEDTTSYILMGLQFDTDYSYKVKAECSEEEPGVRTFHTLKEPGLVVTGAIFGGGRMADVQGKTEVVIVNCDSIGSIYGGNDIAGTVSGADGATIMLGVNSGDATYSTYGTTGGAIRVTSVYGGGNGYYTYDGVEPGVEIGTTELTDGQFHYSVTEVGGEESYMTSGVIPTITKTAITVSNDYVKIDSIFGGAKNAFLTFDDYTQDGSLITVNGGTIMAVFGGNNFGGDQGRGKHHIVVNGTTTHLSPSIGNTATTGYGRDFGIRYLFGGGNKVYGSTTNVEIFGGQCDTIFAGGNSADVWAAYLTVNCALAANSGIDYIYGDVYSNAIQTYDGSVITPKGDYAWDGYTGIYNVRTLFGGNNMATFDSKLNHTVPTITLTSGSVGTVYGGGNAGDMWGLSNDDGTGNPLVINDDVVKYGTHVKMASPDILIDNLYGGCQVSNVLYSTWVELLDGHVGTVYGGCNVSGDVGSTRVNPNAPDIPTTLEEQAVFGGTYVVASGGMVYKNLFAGGNGYYHCLDPYGYYISGLNYTEHNYVGLSSPTHNETHVVVKPGAIVKGNVYAGGNLARVGFNNSTVGSNPYPKLVGLTSVRMSGGRVYGSVYGGGNMADVYGGCEVQVSGGTIDHSLYGGNDRLGKVNNPASNRIFPESYNKASDGVTSLLDPKVYTYVGLTGDPTITNVYGGGNGDYAYFTTFEAAQAYVDGGGTKETVVTCDATNEPIQQNTFVDVGVNGGENGAHIGTVYGGGDGVTVTGFITVFLNVKTDPIGFSNVGTIFGGNNKGPLALPADIILLNGQVNTVYGGCNEGAMNATDFTKPVGDYTDIGSYVRLLSTYDGDGDGHDAVIPNVKVMDAIYGGCRMNGVTRNSLVLVDGGDFSNIPIYGGSDISGAVGGWSRVATTGGTVGNVYGGGNGNYDYVEGGNVYKPGSDHTDENLVATGITTAPICAQSGADILGGSVGTADLLNDGTVAQVFGAGYGKDTETTGDVVVNVGSKVPTLSNNTPILPNIYGDIYGGSAFGDVNTDDISGGTVTTSTTVNLFNGTLHSVTETVGGFEVHHGGNVYGGGLGRKEATGVTAIAAKVYGKVYVNVSSEDQDPENCYLNLREANIFGCNNANGSPQDDVVVHVWRTADTIGEYNSQSGSLYAIRQVFGGGNQADYTPTGKKTLVYVHDCRNTIKRVFSGGNAAAATGVSAIIEGGRFDYIFGGGNGEVSAANIGAGGTDLTVSAGIINHLFGGSNLQGEITGPVNTDVNGDNMGSACAETINEFFGGSNEAGLEANVYTLIECGSGLIGDMYGGSNKANITGNVRLDVRGGSFTNVYGGSKGVLNGTAANITGNVTLNLEGGTIVNAYGGNNQNGNITGKITVNVIDYELEDCELDLTNVYGGGNLASYSPTNYAQDGPIVNVMHIKQAGTQQVQGVKGNVFGGGNQAQVNAHTKVNIGYNATTMSDYLPDDLNTASNQPNTANFHAYVTGNVYGGGNEAGIGYKDEQEQLHGGNTYINIYNGEVCQHIASGEQSVGIYGGCNTTGTVLGNSRVTLLGGTVGNSTTRANIHGGGFGSATLVEGNVTVTFGEVIYDNSGASPVEVHTDEPILYGDLYGGSALGHVNHNNTQTTTVHILNGEITGVPDPGDIQAQYGNVFGGGLGNADHAALVKGRVYVYIGACDTPPSSDLSGQAKLDKCNVFGCNNKNGSPQDDVEVHVYKTYQIAGTNTFNDDDYAVLRTFGGGNESNYAPENNNPNSQKKTHVYVHSCDNTIKYVYGGSNAAAAVGVQTLIEGGRFREIYGGGNGTSIPANIGLGGIGINVNGGYASYYIEGCNHLGTIAGPINQPRPSFPDGYTVCSGSLVIDSYYFGDNEAEHFGDLVGEITCDQASHFNFKNVFAGSRWAIVYGDIKLTVKGGNIEYLFGGSQGYIEDNYPADVRRFPSLEEIEDMNELHPGYYSQKLIDTVTHNPSLIGTGGNILLIVQGGTIGDVIGGCQELGNVEGKITVIIDALDNADCPLVIGNVYGASLQTDYEPIDDDTHHAYFEPGTANAVPTPQVKILKGTVGSDSPVTFNVTGNVHQMEGNVYGGGDIGNVTANPKVIIGNSNTSPVEIKGNVYGGGKDGSVDGSPEVIIVPIKHTLTITQPDATDGVIRVTDRQGNTINSGATIDEYQDLNLVAIPSAYGKKLDKWVVTNGSVLFEKSVNTMFTMGTANASITATFTSVDTYSLTVTHQGEGSVAVTDAQGNGWTGDDIGVGAVLNIVATPTPNSGYTFLRWEVVGTGSTVANANAATTTFTMGTANTTLKAVFVPTHQLTIATPEHGTITVTDIHGQTVTSGAYIGEGALLNIVAHPANTYEFTSWTVTNGTVTDATAISTTFVMGTASGGASISATFHEQPNP